MSENKAGFLSPISSKITVTKEKERRKRKSEEEERRGREKSNGCTLGFYKGYYGDSFWTKKLNCRTQKGLFGGKALKNTVQIDPRLMRLKNSSEWHSETVLLN